MFPLGSLFKTESHIPRPFNIRKLIFMFFPLVLAENLVFLK